MNTARSTARAREVGGTTQVADKPGSGRTFAVLLGHVLRLQARGAVVWGVLLGLSGLMMVSVFPAIADGPALESLSDSLPQGVWQAAGVENVANMGTIEGFLQAELFGLVVPLALPFFAILAAAGAIAGAEENGTIDVLLGNPLPRWQLVVSYFLSTAVSLAVILAILGAFLWGAAQLFDVSLPVGTAAEGVFGVWPLCLFFGGFAILCSALFHRRILAIGISGAVLVGMYILDTLGGLVEDLEGARNLSAIHYYGSPITDGIDWANFAGLSFAALVLAAVAVVAFRRRDIYT